LEHEKSGSEYIIAISIVASALILSGVIWVAASGVNANLFELKSAIESIQITGGGPTGGTLQPTATVPAGATVFTPEQVNAFLAKAAGVKGSDSAEIAILEFSDYQCPYCRRHFNAVYPQIDGAYVKSGKAKLAFLDFPLDFHPSAPLAANAARCAGEQGKYWEAHDAVFAGQNPQGQGTVQFSAQDVKQWIGNVSGIDKNKLDTCIDSNKYADKVKENAQLGQQVGITGTPGFLIGGYLLTGACPFESFKTAIDSVLDGKGFSQTPDSCIINVLS